MMEAGAPTQATTASTPIRNADVAWDLFDSQAYQRLNYLKLHDLDRDIIKIIGKFFESVADDLGAAQAVDVGSGTNIYPALAMLPLASSIEFWEYSANNVAWLLETLDAAGRGDCPRWQPFWDLLCDSSPLYKNIGDPLIELHDRAIRPRQRNVFKLPQAQWDLGTMFFVAESITTDVAQFKDATRRFVDALKPGAPFAAAFMENSHGYEVAGQKFPAVAVSEQDVRRTLSGITTELVLHRVFSPNKFRKGYEGMILATGRRGDKVSGPSR